MNTSILKRIQLFSLLPAGSIVAEIGVWKGYFSIEILNHAPTVKKLFMVDPWAKLANYHDDINEQDQEANLRECRQYCRGHPEWERWEIIRATSLFASVDPKIPMLDAVYIDADHSYKAVLSDLVAWSKKLKPGGLIMGHDYCHFDLGHGYRIEVPEAVTDFCKNYGWELTHLTKEESPSYVLRKVAGSTIPKIIHQIWVGEFIPANIVRMMQTVTHLNPSLDYKLWREKDLAEIGVAVDGLLKTYGHGVYPSDVGRLIILQKFGGIYLDCDFECYRSLAPLCECEAFTALVDRDEQGQLRYCTAAFGAIPDHPCINWMVERIGEYVKTGMPWAVRLASAAPMGRVTILPTEWIYPWRWYDPPEKKHPTADSYLGHHWAGSWGQ